MITQTGLLEYLSSQNITFYPIIQKGLSRKADSEEYDQTTSGLFFHFPKSVAVMGIGTDGHISSLAPNRKDFTNPMFEEEGKNLFVGNFNDTKSDYKERIGMTFAGLSLIDFFLVLAFGKEKQKPLQDMFAQGSMEEVPARFFPQSASQNTVIITDQQI